MTKIKIQALEKKISHYFLKAGMNAENAKIITDVYIRATFRGVGHHDIDSLFSRIKGIIENRFSPNPIIEKTSGFSALECYDGDNGLGELCTYFVTEKSMELAKQYGIGLATIRNSNHFLSAAPYNEIAEEKGFLTLVLSKSPGGLSLPGADKNIMGNNPFGYAAGYNEGKLLFDICCSYSSFGKMREKTKNKEEVPAYWGNDSDGNPTTDPNKILDSGLYMPVGEHKGFGLAIFVELFTAIIANGTILNQGIEETGLKGIYSQTAISIDVSKIMNESTYKDRNQEMINILKELYPDVYIPGERSVRVRRELESKGYIEIDDNIFSKIDTLLNL